jgi:anti-sigma factor RsiW
MNHPHDGAPEHQRVWEMLTWYVNGSATPDATRMVEAHLAECPACRAEHEIQRKLFAQMQRDPAPGLDASAGLARLMANIDRMPQREPADARPMGRAMKLALAGLAAIVLIESGTLAVISAQWMDGRADAPYQTLSTPEPAVRHAAIRMVPAPSMSAGDLQRMLRQLDLEIVGGPSEAGVYSLAPTVPRSDKAAQLAQLRATPGVLFAEPVLPPGAPR